MHLTKKILVIIVGLLMMVGCLKKEYKFEIASDLIIKDQSEEVFNLNTLDEFVTLTYGDEKQALDNVELTGNVDLSKIGSYPITLTSTYKNNLAEVQLTLSVIDRQKPVLHIFEKELLVHVDEEVEINSSNFFINLTDGINGQISERIKVVGTYDLKTVGTYPVQLVGSDQSGNETSENITIRVTDIIDEKAVYLYKKAVIAAKGENFVFKDNDRNAQIINFEDAMAIFQPSYREHFLWLSGIVGEYNPKQSGVKLILEDGLYFADYSLFEDLKGFKNTALEIQYEDETFRRYLAKSTYQTNDEEDVKITKFLIRKIDGTWLVDEFYLFYE